MAANETPSRPASESASLAGLPPIVGGAVSEAVLSREEARRLTDEVKLDAERLWRKLVELYDGNAHRSLDYASWGDYFKAEFGGSRTRAYELLSAGRVLDTVRNSGLPPANEAQANELAPLLKEPEQLREAWQEAIERSSGRPTASIVREVVTERRVERHPVISVSIDDDVLARQQRATLIEGLDRAIYRMEAPAEHARAEARRAVEDGDAGPLSPQRFARVIEYAEAFADELRKEGVG